MVRDKLQKKILTGDTYKMTNTNSGEPLNNGYNQAGSQASLWSASRSGRTIQPLNTNINTNAGANNQPVANNAQSMSLWEAYHQAPVATNTQASTGVSAQIIGHKSGRASGMVNNNRMPSGTTEPFATTNTTRNYSSNSRVAGRINPVQNNVASQNSVANRAVQPAATNANTTAAASADGFLPTVRQYSDKAVPSKKYLEMQAHKAQSSTNVDRNYGPFSIRQTSAVIKNRNNLQHQMQSANKPVAHMNDLRRQAESDAKAKAKADVLRQYQAAKRESEAAKAKQAAAMAKLQAIVDENKRREEAAQKQMAALKQVQAEQAKRAQQQQAQQAQRQAAMKQQAALQQTTQTQPAKKMTAIERALANAKQTAKSNEGRVLANDNIFAPNTSKTVVDDEMNFEDGNEHISAAADVVAMADATNNNTETSTQETAAAQDLAASATDAAAIQRPGLFTRLASTDVTFTFNFDKRKIMHIIRSIAIVLIVAASIYLAWDTYNTNRSVKKTLGNSGSAASAMSISGTNPATADQTAISQEDRANYTVPTDQPRFIYIPSINVNARVLSVGVNSKGNIDTPSNLNDTAWYDGSAKPDKEGEVFIDGHTSFNNNIAAAFNALPNLKKNAKITIELGDGKKINYTVKKVETVDTDKVDMAKALNPIDGAKKGLTLMTCAGKFNYRTQNADKRLIVYAIQD